MSRKHKPKLTKYIVKEKIKAFIGQRDFGELHVGQVVELTANEHQILKPYLEKYNGV